MKKVSIFALAIGSLLFLLAAQSDASRFFWKKEVQPDWQTHFNDVTFLTGNGAWAIGDRGVIARTTDSGATWAAQTSGTTDDLQGLYFVDPSYGWIVGDSGAILNTTDGGSTWSSQSSGVSDTLYGVHFVDAITGWAVGGGGTIINTTDGGSVWSAQTSTTLNALYGVYFSSTTPTNGWAGGRHGTLLRTTDSGSSWAAQATGLSEGPDLRGIDFNSGNTFGLIVGAEGTILRSPDSGVTWGPVSSGTDQYLYSVDFFDGQDAWIAGGQTTDPGIILRSSDDGVTWTPQVPVIASTFRQLLGISFNSSWDGIAVGRYGVILRSSDAGVSWSQVTETAANLRGYDSPDADGTNAWACGSMGTVIMTSDRWASTRFEQATGVYNELNAISFPSTTYGWAVGMGRKPYQHVTPTPGATPVPNTVIKTINGGTTWTRLNLGPDVDENMYDVFMLDASSNSRGWVCGGWGSVFYTADGGNSWTLQDTNNDAYDEWNTLLGIHFINDQEGWACGSRLLPTPGATPQAIMINTTNGGSNWTSQTPNVDVDLYDVLAIRSGADTYGWAAGSEGTIIRTQDGGTTWNRVTSNSNTLFAIDFTDIQDGIAVGGAAVYPQSTSQPAYRTTNTGWCWELQETVASFDVYDVLMINDTNAWASTAWGEILKYTDVAETPPIAVIRGQGAGLFDLNLYQYWSSAIGDAVYWDAVARNPSPYYYARDLWSIVVGNDIVAAAPVDIDSDGEDEIAVIKNQGGDYNLYVYNALEYGDTTYWDALARNPSPLARDFWYIPSGNNTIAFAGVKIDNQQDLIAILKNEGGRQKLYYYNVPAPGEYVWAQAFIRNGLGPYAFDEWYVPASGSIVAMAGADGTAAGKDKLVTVTNSWGDYNLFVWNPPAVAGYYNTEFRNRALQLGFGGFGTPQAQDLWIVPQRNDIVSISALKADDSYGNYPGNYDALGVMENQWGDRNFYLWKVPVKPESTYIEAQVRQVGYGGLGTPQGSDFWAIPAAPGGGSAPWIVGLDTSD